MGSSESESRPESPSRQNRPGRCREPVAGAPARPGGEATDKDARLFRKGAGQESRLCYLGHALMENRNRLVAAAEATLATGTAEREAAARISQRLPKGASARRRQGL